MEIAFPLSSGACLKLTPAAENQPGYPTSQLQKGLVLTFNGQDLAEEGVGFGVPVLKFGVKTIFPAAVELFNCTEGQEVSAIYRMNLEERLSAPRLRNRSLYQIKNHLADIYRRYPTTRRALTALSNALRDGFGWQTTYEYAGWDYSLSMHYAVESQAGIVSVSIDTTELPKEGLTEVVVMNEQGAHYFDTYSDSNGMHLHGEAIGSWEEVTAAHASFVSRSHGLAFSLPRLAGARLFRGRELIIERLAWAGFGYSILPTSQRFVYSLKIERLP